MNKNDYSTLLSDYVSSYTRARLLILRALPCIIVLLFVLSNAGLAKESDKQSTAQAIISITKGVILNAATMGLEEAGNWLMGPTVWRYFKAAAMPVFKELKKQYPSLFLEKDKGTTNARITAEKAVEYLSENEHLQKLLVKGFQDLKTGQQEILAQIQRVDVELKWMNSSLDKMNSLNQENFTHILSELGKIRKSTETLKEIDIAEETAKALRQFAPELGEKRIVKLQHSMKVNSYALAVLDKGAVSQGFKRTIDDTDYRVYVEASYRNQYDRECRRLRIYSSDPKEIRGNPVIYCRDKEGRWAISGSKTAASISHTDWQLVANETFSKAAPEWLIGNITDEAITRADTRIVGGRYRWDLMFRKAMERTKEAPYASVVNFYVAVDVKMPEYDSVKGAGLLFGRVSNKDYTFLISSNKKFFLRRFDGKENEYLIWGLIDIDPKENNRLEVLADDLNIKLYINSLLVGEYRDPAFTGGKVGVVVTGWDAGCLVVDFDNFELRRKPN